MEILVHNNYCTLYNDKSREVIYFVGKYLTVTEYVSKYNIYQKKYVREPNTERLYQYSSSNNMITFGRGVLDMLTDEDRQHITITYQEHSRINTEFDIDRDDIKHSIPGFTLRDDQVMAVYKALKRKRGIIQMPTGSGKSLIITAITNQILRHNPSAKILILAPTVVTIDNIIQYLHKIPCTISNYRKSKSSCEQVIVGHPKSIANIEELNQFDAVLWDEVQHLSCNTWKSLNSELTDVVYNIGFSALVLDSTSSKVEVDKLSSQSASVIAQCGSIIMNASASYYINTDLLSKLVVFRVKDEIPKYLPDEEQNYSAIYECYIESSERTEEVSSITKVFSDCHRRVLILTSRKSQAWSISEKISPYAPVVLSFGSGEGYLATSEGVSKLPDSVPTFNNDQSYKILIATTHLDEGVDLSNLDVCILASGGAKPRRIIQRVGRVLRKTKTGKYAYLIDFYGTNSNVLKNHSNSRLKLYKDELGVSSELLYKEIMISQVKDKFFKLEGIST